ncbi:AbiTii domain-containing protein [Comamonas terrigena]|uniref:AbiTii domain-containing protein n=1 Tax=Comamonas terrigena TaxID=32013 RepID=UPI002356FF65|nr:hypothetical protein [Comamonas terrigena]
MTGLVLYLQKDALDSRVGLAELLRKALVVSHKLKVNSAQRWINLELAGYDSATEEDWEKVKYREIRGRLHFFNPYKGLIPGRIDREDVSSLLEMTKIYQSVSEIEDLLNSPASELKQQFPHDQSEIIRGVFKTNFEPWLVLSRQNLVGVLDAARKKVLDWALELESQGILGVGMTFSKNEQQAASQIHYSTVNNIGSMSNSQLQLHSSGVQNMANKDGVELAKKLIEALESVSSVLKLSRSEESELRAEIETIKAQIASPKPKIAVLKECFLSAKAILEGASGNVLASGIATQIPAVVAALGG